jgi:hypothetical protein
MSIPTPMRDQTAAAPPAGDNAHSRGIRSNLGTLLRTSFSVHSRTSKRSEESTNP